MLLSPSSRDSFQLAAYSGWGRDDYYLYANVSVGYHEAESDRAVVIGAATILPA